jgi:hypothetical protein
MQQKDSLNTEFLSSDSHLLKTQDSLSQFFTSKGAVKINEVKLSHAKETPLWLHISLFLGVIILILARHFYWAQLQQIFRLTLHLKSKKAQRESNRQNQGFPILLLILYYYSLAAFVFLLINKYLPNTFYFSLGGGFLILLSILISIYLIKFLVIWFSGILFETKSVSQAYLSDYYLFQVSEGILLFPILILFVYSELQFFLYLAILLHVSLWIYRFFRAIIIGLGCTNFSRSYLFLYLCTLEVVPFIFLYKMMIQFI